MFLGFPFALAIGLTTRMLRGMADSFLISLFFWLIGFAPLLVTQLRAIGFGRALLIYVFGGVIVGLFGLLAGGLVNLAMRNKEIESREAILLSETLQWSWQEFFSHFFSKLSNGLIVGALGGVIAGLGFLAVNPTRQVVFGLGVLVGGASIVVGVTSSLLSGWSAKEIERRLTPNQGIRRSFWNACFGGLVSGVIAAVAGGILGWMLAVGFGDRSLEDLLKAFWVLGAVFSLIGGIIGGLQTGGAACLQHFILRLLLVRNGQAPLNYPAFLDYAADCLFLRKVGGGYAFVHRTLLEHFAALPSPQRLGLPK